MSYVFQESVAVYQLQGVCVFKEISCSQLLYYHV